MCWEQLVSSSGSDPGGREGEMGGAWEPIDYCSLIAWQVQEYSYIELNLLAFNSVQFSSSVVSDSLPPNGLQYARPPCPSPTPRVYSNSCPLSGWCHPTISSSVVPFSCLQAFPASGAFQMSQFFTSGGQSSGFSASTSVLPMNIQDWFPWGLTGLISLQPKGLSRIYSSPTIRKHQFFGPQPSL